MSNGLMSVKLGIMQNHRSKSIKGVAMIKGKAQIGYMELDYRYTPL